MSEKRVDIHIRADASGVKQGADQAAKSLDDLGKKGAESARRSGEGFRQVASDLGMMEGQSGIATRVMLGLSSSLGSVASAALVAGAAMGRAYVKGAQEGERLAAAVITVGGAVGATNGQLAAMASQVADVSDVTTSSMVGALDAVVRSGKVAVENYGLVAQAAAEWERVTGRAAAEVVAEHSKLGEAPVEASIKLNEQYNYLTAAVFEQIKALQDQGRTVEAATLAQKAYADAMLSRSGEIEQSLGTMSRLWLGLKDTAAQAWDAMLGIGRDDGGLVSVERLNKALATMQGKGYLSGGLFGGSQDEAMQIIRLYEAQQEAQKKQVDAQTRQNNGMRDYTRFSELAAQYADKETRKRKEIADLRQRYMGATQADGVNQAALAADYEKALAGIESKYKEPKGKKPKADRHVSTFDDTVIQRINQAISQTDTVKAQELEATLARLNELAAAGLDPQIIEEARALLDPMEQLRQKYVDMADPIQKYREALDEVGRLRERYPAQAEVWMEAEMQIHEAMDKTLDKTAEVKDKGNDAFKELQRSVEGWGKSSADAIVDFAVTGKASFGDMVQSMIADLAKMMVYQNITKPLFAGASTWLSGLNLFGGGAAASSSSSGSGFLGSGIKPNAKGGVYDSPSLSAYSNQVHSSPKLFAFAKGAGVFGEAGPEAIMPLTRGPDGNLGVRASGGGGVSIEINNYSGQAVQTKEVADGRGGRKVSLVIGEVVAGETRRPGSPMNRAMRQSFGLAPALNGR